MGHCMCGVFYGCAGCVVRLCVGESSDGCLPVVACDIGRCVLIRSSTLWPAIVLFTLLYQREQSVLRTPRVHVVLSRPRTGRQEVAVSDGFARSLICKDKTAKVYTDEADSCMPADRPHAEYL